MADSEWNGVFRSTIVAIVSSCVAEDVVLPWYLSPIDRDLSHMLAKFSKSIRLIELASPASGECGCKDGHV
jgi:hypothetical protein